MSTERKPLISDEQIKEYGATYVPPYSTEVIRAMAHTRSIYEAARAKDAELIQRLVDALRRERLNYSDIVDMMNIDYALAAAKAAGFTPTPDQG